MIGIRVYHSDGSACFLDLLPNTLLNIESVLPAFDTNLESGLYSLPIDIPFTAKNRNWLMHVNNLNSYNDALPEYWQCDVYDNGVPVLLYAKLTLLNHKGRFDGSLGNYSFTISGIKGIFGSLIKYKKMTELSLGGIIDWGGGGQDSREYATLVMQQIAGDDTYDRLRFAPVALPEYIDTQRADYLGERLNQDTANAIVIDNAYSNGWIFGRENGSAPGTIIFNGDPTYEDYRTIPFFNLFYVLKKIFTEQGFTVGGSFFDYPDFEKLYLFNNHAIEKYDYPFTIDINRVIDPKNHMPNILIVDFLRAIQNTFNLRIVFDDNKNVQIDFNLNLLTVGEVKNFSNKCLSLYDNAVRHQAYEDGVTMQWTWDSNDQYSTDRVKDMTEKQIIETVFLFTDIAGLTFSIALTDSMYILVEAENWFYNYNTSQSIWEPYCENQFDKKIGKGNITYSPAIAPMLQYYAWNGTTSLTERKNMVCSYAKGTYMSANRMLIENESGLRLFYINELTTGAYSNLPISHTHTTDGNGLKLADTSLSWLAKDGLYVRFWALWINMLIQSWMVSCRFQLHIVDISNINDNDIIMVQSNQYLIQKISYTLPIKEPVQLDLVKL